MVCLFCFLPFSFEYIYIYESVCYHYLWLICLSFEASIQISKSFTSTKLSGTCTVKLQCLEQQNLEYHGYAGVI